MKICHCCTAQLDDDALYCRNCGASQPGMEKPVPQPVSIPLPEKDELDHTEEFDAADICANKLYAMIVYLLDFVGIFLVLLGAKDSPYAMFHVRQGLKFTVLEAVLGIAAAVLCWTFVVPIAAAVCMVVLISVRLVCFLQVCKGMAKEPSIIHKLKFLN